MIKDTYQKLSHSSYFINWQKQNKDNYLTHFYHPVNDKFELIGDWEIGFYSKEKDKITTFMIKEPIEVKPEEDPFKKEGVVEELDLNQLKIGIKDIFKIFKEIKEKKYTKEILLNGFLILQKFKGKTMWNLSFATKSMQILNIKIDVDEGKVISDQIINFIQQQAS